MSWGYRIILIYVGFVALIVTLITISMRQDIDLVAKDYYAKELAYQSTIDKQEKSVEHSMQVKISIENGDLKIQFPDQVSTAKISGNANVYCPSNEKFDFNEAIILNDKNIHSIALSKFKKSGKHRIQVDWTDGVHQYYTEEIIHIPLL